MSVSADKGWHLIQSGHVGKILQIHNFFSCLRSMECRIFIDVDCTDEAKTAELSTDILKEKLEKQDREYSKAEAKNMLCNLMDL